MSKTVAAPAEGAGLAAVEAEIVRLDGEILRLNDRRRPVARAQLLGPGLAGGADHGAITLRASLDVAIGDAQAARARLARELAERRLAGLPAPDALDGEIAAAEERARVARRAAEEARGLVEERRERAERARALQAEIRAAVAAEAAWGAERERDARTLQTALDRSGSRESAGGYVARRLAEGSL